VAWLGRTSIELIASQLDPTISHKIEQVEYIVHKLDGKYLPDPFWVEEKRTLVVEGLSDDGFIRNHSIIVNFGEEYTFIIDDIEYTAKGEYDGADYYVELCDSDGVMVAYVVHALGITFGDYNIYHEDKYHKVELVEKVYHTHHDFMVFFNAQEGENISRDCKLVAGDFTKAKARVLKGLPVTAYVCSTIVDDGSKGYINYETQMAYFIENGKEYMYNYSGDSFLINPDNTIQVD
jgi:hypothetical protein